MLRSFDPVPDEPVLVLDLFSGMGTGMLAATDTPKITGASHVIWVSVEKDDDVALLHYNSARAAITSQVFGELKRAVVVQWLAIFNDKVLSKMLGLRSTEYGKSNESPSDILDLQVIFQEPVDDKVSPRYPKVDDLSLDPKVSPRSDKDSGASISN